MLVTHKLMLVTQKIMLVTHKLMLMVVTNIGRHWH